MRDVRGERSSTSGPQEEATRVGPGPGKNALTEMVPATSPPAERKADPAFQRNEDAAPAMPNAPRPSIADLFGRRVERQASASQTEALSPMAAPLPPPQAKVAVASPAATQSVTAHPAVTPPAPAIAPTGHAPFPAHDEPAHDEPTAAPHVIAAPTSRAAPRLSNAKLSEAAKRIEQAATTQKAAIHASAQAEQHTVTAEAVGKAAAIQHSASAKISAMLASIGQKRAAISSTFAQARAKVSAKTAADRAKAESDGAKALADLHKLIADKKKAAKDGAETEAKGLEATGQTQATRAHTETSTTVSTIEGAASSAIGSAGGDADVQAAVTDAVNQAKSDAISKAQKQGNDVATKATHDAHDAAQKIRDGGNKLSDEVGSKTTDVEKSITDATTAAVQRITTIEQTNLQQLTALEQNSLAALDKVKAKIAPPIRSAASKAAAQARTAGHQTAAAVQRAATAQSQAIDHAEHEAHSKLAAHRHGEVDAAALDQAVTAITASFAHIHQEGSAAIRSEAGKVKTQIARVQQQLTASLNSVGAKIDAQIEHAVASAHQGAAQATAKVDEDGRQALADLAQAHTKAKTDFGNQLQRKIDDGNQKWKSQRTEHEGKIRDDVDHGLRGVIDVRSQIGPKLQEIAQKAKAKQDRPWWEKALSGIWEGLKSFVGGLLVFIAAVLIIALVVLLFVSGIGEALMIAAEIAGIIFLVVGFVSALVSRWGELMARLKAGNYPWYAAFGLGALTVLAAAGDVIGLTPLVEGIVGHDAVSWAPLSSEERWKRGTMGALTLITLGLARRAKVGGEDSGEPNLGGHDAPGEDGRTPGHGDGGPGANDNGRPPGHDAGGHEPTSGHDNGGNEPSRPSGHDPSHEPGHEPSHEPGHEPSHEPPTQPGKDPSQEPPKQPGKDPEPVVEVRSRKGNGEPGKVIGRFQRGSQLEIISRSEKLYGGNKIELAPGETTTVTGTLADTEVVATRGRNFDDSLNGATESGENPGGVNILRSPKWGEIQSRYKYLGDTTPEYWRAVSDAFWNEVNKPWLDEAMARGDAFRFVSDPTAETSLYVTKKGTSEFVLDENGQRIQSIFSRELDYLRDHGYVFQPDGTAIKPKKP